MKITVVHSGPYLYLCNKAVAIVTAIHTAHAHGARVC
jgi:hypothetical protein